MNIAIALSGHLRNNPYNCIESSINFLKHYSKNIDLFINTYNTIGSHVSAKNYSTLKTEYVYDSDSSVKVLEIINERFNPKNVQINKFEEYQKEIILPKAQELLKKIEDYQNGPKVINPGLITGLIAQSSLRRDVLKTIFDSNKDYDCILIARPDINLNNLEPVNLKNEIYHVQSTPFFNRDRSIYIQNNFIHNKIAKKFHFGFSKKFLIDDLLFFGKSKIIREMYEEFFNKIEDVIFQSYKSSPNFMTYTYGPTTYNKTLPNWEMPEYIFAKWAEIAEVNFRQIAYFELQNNDNIRQFVLNKNI